MTTELPDENMIGYRRVLITKEDKFTELVRLMSDEAVEGGSDDELSFSKLSKSWFQSCLGFFEAFPMFGAVAHIVHLQKVDESVVSFVESVAVKSEVIPSETDAKVSTIHSVEERHIYKIVRAIDVLNQYKRAEVAFTRAQLLAILAEYEAFTSDLLRLTIGVNPDAFISKDSTISAVEIIKGADLDSIKSSIIEDKIDSMQRESHVEQIKLICERLKIPTPDPIALREFGEICERRNIITHANGRANKTYRAKLAKLGFAERDIPQIGHELIVDDHYIKRSTARIFQMGYFVLHIVWQHLVADEHERSIKILINDSHDFLKSGHTKMAGRVCEFVLNRKSPANELDRAYALINLALSFHLNHKMNDDERKKKVEETLARRDWSIVDAMFALAICCLREDLDHLPNAIDAAIRDGLPADAFLTWALFTKVRGTPVFSAKMAEHFNLPIDDPTVVRGADGSGRGPEVAPPVLN